MKNCDWLNFSYLMRYTLCKNLCSNYCYAFVSYDKWYISSEL